MPEESNPPQPVRRAPIPAGVFAPDRRPSFVLFTKTGAEARMDDRWLTDGPERYVYVSPFDFAELLAYLRRHVHAIVSAYDTSLGHRAWALHRVLLTEATAVLRVDAPMTSADMVRCARELAAFTVRDPRAFAELNALFGGAYMPASHAVETAIVAVALAVADGVTDLERLTGIALGGIFADSGKVELTAETLDRSGPLTDSEWERMVLHPRRSAERLRNAGVSLAQALRGALHHHERWDGDGYPDKQRGEAIPVEARYLAIADAFSAMTAERSYRSKRTPFEAVAEMVADGGFEPRLLRVFVPLLRKPAAQDEDATEKGALGRAA